MAKGYGVARMFYSPLPNAYIVFRLPRSEKALSGKLTMSFQAMYLKKCNTTKLYQTDAITK